MTKFLRTWVVALLLSPIAGCAALFEYPDDQAEANLAACANEKDDDFDGLTDCADPDCNGSCPEEDAAACNNGKDDDADGLADLQDPRCWPFAPPDVRRCATTGGADVTENFDTDALFGSLPYSEWTSFGSVRDPTGITSVFGISAFTRRPWGRHASHVVFRRVGRPDTAAPGGMMRTWQFAGTWDDFALSFDASVPLGAMLKVGIIPAELAPHFGSPLPGAENAPLVVTLDGMSSPATFTLQLEGTPHVVPLPLTRTPCAGGLSQCEDDLGAIRVAVVGDEIVATFERPNGERAEVRGPRPTSRRLPPSRLVFWGDTAVPGPRGVLDTIRLHVGAERPCGVASPQIPAAVCGSSEDTRRFGDGVSLAQGADGEHCALVTARSDGDAPGAAQVTAWRSADGSTWTAASSSSRPAVALPEGTSLIGAAVAHDGREFHVVAAYRDGADVRLGAASGEACGGWGRLEPGSSLFPDAEAPSLVLRDGERSVYFTRPPAAGARRTLWRARFAKGASVLEPELLAELPEGVANPVSVRRIGGRDLVLVHPTLSSSGFSDVGLLVGDSQGRSWAKVDTAQAFSTPAGVEDYGGSLSFDARGVLAAALFWNEQGGFVLYGASSTPELQTGDAPKPRASVGTARLVTAGGAFPEVAPSSGRCGDGSCGAGEDCESCPSDCECPGVTILSDVLGSADSWQSAVSDPPGPVPMQYIDPETESLNWAGGVDSWAALSLDRPLSGDFELSFDFTAAFAEDTDGIPPCSLYVGLGSVTDGATFERGDGAGIGAGVFARFRYGSICSWRYTAAAAVVADGRAVGGSVEATADGTGCESQDATRSVERKRRVTLRREGTLVTVGTQRDDGCSETIASAEYASGLPELSTLLAGFGGGPFATCGRRGGSGTIRDVRLRLLQDPARCPAGTAPCAKGASEPTCVDTRESAEHCGACGHACGANEVCRAGACVCGDRPGLLSCGGLCVDSLADVEHCGDCETVCKRSCKNATCDVPGDCDVPISLSGDDPVYEFELARQPSDAALSCGGPSHGTHATTFEWTASTTGAATILVIAPVAVVVGVTSDSTCGGERWMICDVVKPEPLSMTALPVIAGTTYRIVVALPLGSDPSVASGLLRIGAPP